MKKDAAFKLAERAKELKPRARIIPHLHDCKDKNSEWEVFVEWKQGGAWKHTTLLKESDLIILESENKPPQNFCGYLILN